MYVFGSLCVGPVKYCRQGGRLGGSGPHMTYINRYLYLTTQFILSYTCINMSRVNEESMYLMRHIPVKNGCIYSTAHVQVYKKRK